jgi:predicted transcriptional regulator of viral defense system
MFRQRQERSPNRMPEPAWEATVTRVRAEFEEMPCMRVTVKQACVLFGLSDAASNWILGRLAHEGFLDRTSSGEYLRRIATP